MNRHLPFFHGGNAFPRSRRIEIVSEPGDNTIRRIPGRLYGSTAEYLRRNRLEMVILLCMGAVYFFAYFQRVAVPGTIFDELQSSFHTSAGAVAWLAAIYLYIYGGTTFLAGVMSDRFGAVKVLLTGGFLMSVGSVSFPFSRSLLMLYATGGLVGFGAGLIYLSIVKALDGLFGEEHFAVFLGVTLFFGNLGGLVGTFPFERLVHWVGWRGALLAAGILCTVAFLAAVLLFSKTHRIRQQRIPLSDLNFRAILGSRQSRLLLIAGPINFGIYFLVQATIGKKFLTDHCGMSSAMAATFTFVMMFVTMVMGLAGGFVSRLLGNRRKPVIVASTLFTLVSVGFLEVCLRFGLGRGWILLCYVILGSSSLAGPISAALMKESNPSGATGTAIGVLNGACYMAVALITNLAGYVMDSFRSNAVATATAVIYPRAAYETIFSSCFVLAVAALICVLRLRESYGKSIFARDFPDDGRLAARPPTT